MKIKVRQWVGGEFHYWGVGMSDTQGYHSSFIGPVSGGLLRADQTPQELYTGLKDCEGTEIYAGDILKVTSKVGNELLVVGYFMGNACFMFPGHETGTPIYPALINMTKEVIGNIHQNPELLEDLEEGGV